MAECSQKFKDMLTSFYAEAHEDGKFQVELSGPSLEKEDAILQYVAELEAIRDGIEAQEPAMYVLRSTANRPQPAVVRRQSYLSVAISDLVDMGLAHLDPLYLRLVQAQAAPEHKA